LNGARKALLERFRIDNKVKFVIMLSALVVIAYAFTQLFWVLFVYFGLWETWESNIWLYDSLTKVAGILFLVPTSTILTYKLFRNRAMEKKEVAPKVKNVAISIKRIFKNLLRYILKKAKRAGYVLKTTVIPVTLSLFRKIARFLFRSRKTVLLVVAVALVTLIFSFLLFSSLNVPSDQTIPTTGTIYVRGLEIYGGDITTEGENVYVDWGELTLGTSKNASFYVKSTSNVDVGLTLNVTDWEPAGLEDYIDIYWNYNGTLLSPLQELFVTVNLDVSSSDDFLFFLVENAVTTFGFNITIYASEV